MRLVTGCIEKTVFELGDGRLLVEDAVATLSEPGLGEIFKIKETLSR